MPRWTLLLPLLALACADKTEPEDTSTDDGGTTDTSTPLDSGAGGDTGPVATDEDCTDEIDNDLDGDTDCYDSDCEGTETCIEDCEDGVDNDVDGDLDCQDDDCLGVESCFEHCDDGIDNDDDGLTDCEDLDSCEGKEDCLEICDDGLDNDADGDTDCADGDCADLEECIEACDDGLDNDGDGLYDCEDSDCIDDCLEDCSNTTDDDADGDIDCDDVECFAAEGCESKWLVTMETELTVVAQGTGGLIETYYGYDGWMRLYGDAIFVVEPAEETEETSSFLCSAYIQGLTSPTVTEYGTGLTHAYDEGPYLDVGFDWAPTEDNDSLSWNRPCDVAGVPATTLGFNMDVLGIYRTEDSRTRLQYLADYIYPVSSTDYGGYEINWHIYPVSYRPVQWMGEY